MSGTQAALIGASRATTSIVNAFSTAGWSAATGLASFPTDAKYVVPGALTANTPATLLSVSGAGAMPIFAAFTQDATSRTMRIKVTVDGVVAFDYTSAAITTAGGGAGCVLAGDGPSSGTRSAGPVIEWNSSLLIEWASSLSETGKFGAYYKLITR